MSYVILFITINNWSSLGLTARNNQGIKYGSRHVKLVTFTVVSVLEESYTGSGMSKMRKTRKNNMKRKRDKYRDGGRGGGFYKTLS